VVYLTALYIVTISKPSNGKVAVDNEKAGGRPNEENHEKYKNNRYPSTFEPSASWLGFLQTLAAFRKTRYEY
jgi:ABC-type oligopeptide transport system ATPase subunit